MNRRTKHTLVPSEAICGGLVYLASISDAMADNTLLAYMRIIERAWDDFALTGVLCVDGIPTIYFKEVKQPLSERELNDLHCRFWNQGVAQTLVVADPKTVRIFSGLAKPQKDDTPISDKTTLIKELGRLEFAQQIDSFCQANANGSWYTEHAQHYKSGSSVDAYLLDNLVILRDLLTKGKESKHQLSPYTAHALIGRILFVCYLVDRRIYRFPDVVCADCLNKALKDRSDSVAIDFLYDLFGQLKDEFNGSMFDQDLVAEKKQIQPFHIQILRDFLDGQKPMSPQHNLGFWAYDFKLIPVETISAIYEEFLAHEDPARKRETGAFYTPRFLAEMTLDVAVEGRNDWHTLRYLDPCCGSGIFLVTLFNRLATRWLLDNPVVKDEPDAYLRKAQGLIEILTNNLRGIDVNPTACRLACFSLYIALLDCLSPSDIRTFVLQTKNKLPRLLADDVTDSDDGYIPVVREADFLKVTGFAEESFDCIIGNPPWQGSGSKQLALHILEQVGRFMVENGEGCLLLPSKIFLNSTANKFQADWFKEMTVERVVQLADYSKILFEQAKCPSMIVRFRKTLLQDASHKIAYDTPKFNPTSRRRGLVTISSFDHKWLPQAQLKDAALHNEASVIWKRWLWGTGRDHRLFSYLETLPPLTTLAGSPHDKMRWNRGKGFEPDTNRRNHSPHQPWWNNETLYVSSRSDSFKFGSILYPFECKKIGSDYRCLRRPAFNAGFPVVLVNYGFNNIIFSDFSVIFRNSIHFVSGPPEDENLLLFLTVYLRSKLAKYCMFHTAANWGTERDKVHLEELLRLPFPLPEDAPAPNAHDIVEKIATRMREERKNQENLLEECRSRYRKLTDECDEERAVKEWYKQRKTRTEALQAELEPLIYDYFGLLAPEKMLVEDTVTVFIPSSTPPDAERLNIPTLQPVSRTKISGYESGLTVYAETLTNTLNTWANERGSNFRVSSTIGTDSQSGMAMVTLNVGIDVTPLAEYDLDGELTHWLKRGFDSFARETKTLRSERELFWFEGSKLHIIRPQTLIHWTRTAALNDADTIYGEITQARRFANA
jgi:hypothetical protein